MTQGPSAGKIERMFDHIAPGYDRLNHLLSLDIDKCWRRKARRQTVDRKQRQDILDIACGTGDFALEMAAHCAPGSRITGLDLSAGMLAVMQRKVEALGFEHIISQEQGNCEHLPYPDQSFDCVTVAFGMRNVEHREQALAEVLRVLRPCGRFVMLELSVPSNTVIRFFYNMYFLHILPLIGGRISGDDDAYTYLPDSVLKFPDRKAWTDVMKRCGFIRIRHRALTLGICRMYMGKKDA